MNFIDMKKKIGKKTIASYRLCFTSNCKFVNYCRITWRKCKSLLSFFFLQKPAFAL